MDENVSTEPILNPRIQRNIKVSPFAPTFKRSPILSNVVPSSFFRSAVTSFKMDHGVTHLLNSPTILEKTQNPDCKSGFAMFLTCFSGLILALVSYQRIYFRNANHPISRPSVTTRRHGRCVANEQRTLGRDVERKWVVQACFVKLLIALTWQAVAYLRWEDINQRDSCFSALRYRRSHAKSYD